jgi:hypothetical protein
MMALSRDLILWSVYKHSDLCVPYKSISSANTAFFSFNFRIIITNYPRVESSLLMSGITFYVVAYCKFVLGFVTSVFFAALNLVGSILLCFLLSDGPLLSLSAVSRAQ